MDYSAWRKIYVDKTQTVTGWRKEHKVQRHTELERLTANQGAFSHLKVPMQKREIKQICRDYGVDISFLRIKIQRDESLLRMFLAGSAAPEDVGRIDLFPNAFADVEQLLRTVIHEGCHVKQFIKYGAKYVQENQAFMEKVAYRYEQFFLRIVRKRAKNGKHK